jgi:outer membrane protein insertion porin family
MLEKKTYNLFSLIELPVRFALIIFSIFLINACGVKKFLQKDEAFYKGATITIDDDSIKVQNKKGLSSELNSLTRPKPNKTILGRRQKVWYHFIAGETEKEKGLRHWLKYKLGEEPVLMNEVNPEKNLKILENHLVNNGFFYAVGSFDSSWKKQEGTITYTLKPGHRYRINNVIFPVDSGAIGEFIRQSEEVTVLKKGDPYNFENLKAERIRIDEMLKQKGYYLFNPDYILMRVDSSIGNHLLDIYVTIKKETPKSALTPWKVEDIIIYPGYSADMDTIKVDSSFWRERFFLVDPDSAYKAKMFDRVITFQPNMMYNRDDHNRTLSRLVNLGAFRFVRNRFEEEPLTADTGILNAHYYLIASKKKNIRLETTGRTSSANLAGLELNMNWRNRNMFGGAEQFMLKVYGGFDIQFAGVNQGYNIYSIGAEASLTWPRVVPFRFAQTGPFVPYTRLSLLDDYQNRQRLYTVNTLKATYAWAWRPSLRKEHMLAPIQFTYVDSRNVTQEYLDQIAQDSSLARIIEEQLIFGPEYYFIHNNTLNPKKSNGFYYRNYLNLSNNLLGLLQGANAMQDQTFKMLGVTYSQYIKLEQEVRYYRRLSPKNTSQQWVNRLNVGVGIPWGNSKELPFIKQYFTGGANNLRAFRVRSVGPGTFRPDSINPNSFVPDLVGDMRLEMNTEYRTKLAGILHGAVFLDAGNIWLYNENASRPGGKFTKDFWKELAVGGGLGLRFDIAGIFMLRFDAGIPFRKPWLPDGERWVIKKIDIWDDKWRNENIVYNLAVGLPF